MSCSSSVERKAEESCDAHHTLVESCDAHHTEAIAGLARRSWRRRYLGIGSDVSMGISWTLLRWFLALASRHRYSITPSARATRLVGTSRPSAFAVLRLMTSSYVVGACTGRSAGFSPLRRST